MDIQRLVTRGDGSRSARPRLDLKGLRTGRIQRRQQKGFLLTPADSDCLLLRPPRWRLGPRSVPRGDSLTTERKTTAGSQHGTLFFKQGARSPHPAPGPGRPRADLRDWRRVSHRGGPGAVTGPPGLPHAQCTLAPHRSAGGACAQWGRARRAEGSPSASQHPRTAGPRTTGPRTAGPRTAGPRAAGPRTADALANSPSSFLTKEHGLTRFKWLPRLSHKLLHLAFSDRRRAGSCSEPGWVLGRGHTATGVSDRTENQRRAARRSSSKAAPRAAAAAGVTARLGLGEAAVLQARAGRWEREVAVRGGAPQRAPHGGTALPSSRRVAWPRAPRSQWLPLGLRLRSSPRFTGPATDEGAAGGREGLFP